MFRASIVLLLCLGLPALGAAQQASPVPTLPIPNTSTLLAQVEARQRQLSKTLENYTWTQTTVLDMLDKHGKVRKTTSEQDEIFFVNTHQIERLVKKNGKPLTAKQAKKEQVRVEKAVARALKTPPGKSLHKDAVSVFEILSLMRTTPPRRVMLDGRGTLAFNFTGNPRAHTHGTAEDASKKMAGTLWVDEQSREVRRLTAHFYGTFHMGFGLFSIGRGSTITFDQQPVANGIWLPARMRAHLTGRAIGFLGYHAEVTVTDNNYRVFHAQATQSGSASVVAPK